MAGKEKTGSPLPGGREEKGSVLTGDGRNAGRRTGRRAVSAGRILALVLSLALALGMQPPVKGEARYTYTVRFYAGQQGTVGGGEVMVFENLNYGDRINFSLRDVKLHDNSKYYVKGIRQSGRDNNTAGTTSFVVTEDRDYVVAYGLLKDAVAYTINYRDVEGNELAPSETYYGNIGDRPVVAYLYIAGYQPQAYNLTGTLSENVAENEFTFVYTPVPEGGVTIIPGTVTDLGVQTVVVGGGGAGAGAGAGGGPGLPGGEGPGGGEAPLPEEDLPDQPVPQDQGEGENTGGDQQPQEVVDINEGEVPLAGPGNGEDASLLRLPLAARIGLAGAFVLLLGYGGWRYRRIRVRKNEEEKDEG